MAKVVDNLSTYQLRTHFLLYSSIAAVFANSDIRFHTGSDRVRMRIFLPGHGYFSSMGFSQDEWDNPQILDHIWHGIHADGLVKGD